MSAQSSVSGMMRQIWPLMSIASRVLGMRNSHMFAEAWCAHGEHLRACAPGEDVHSVKIYRNVWSLRMPRSGSSRGRRYSKVRSEIGHIS
jgi:hypothetical protein